VLQKSTTSIGGTKESEAPTNLGSERRFLMTKNLREKKKFWHCAPKKRPRAQIWKGKFYLASGRARLPYMDL
jgi:hypothetical protein